MAVTEKRHHATFRRLRQALHNCRQFLPRQAIAGTRCHDAWSGWFDARNLEKARCCAVQPFTAT